MSQYQKNVAMQSICRNVIYMSQYQKKCRNAKNMS